MNSNRIVVFDLGKVLLDFNNRLISGRLAELSGRPEEEVRRIVFGSLLEKGLDSGKTTPEEFFSGLRAELSLSISYEEFKPLWCRIFTPIPGMKEIVKQLKGNCRLALLSNTNALHFEYLLEQYPILSLFDHHFLSYRLHLLKPDPAIYRAVLDFFHAEPQDMIYFDDIPAYADAALALGIEAVRFESAGQVREILAERL
jgi:putative hydrolase of the HAD superfamily